VCFLGYKVSAVPALLRVHKMHAALLAERALIIAELESSGAIQSPRGTPAELAEPEMEIVPNPEDAAARRRYQGTKVFPQDHADEPTFSNISIELSGSERGTGDN
jgi:hypothetical protein